MKEKTMKKFITTFAIGLMIVMSVTVQAIAQDNLKFLTSREACLAYALGKIEQVHINASSPSMVNYEQNQPWFYAKFSCGGDAVILEKFIGVQRLEFEVGSVNDPINLGVYCSDEDSNTMLYGYRECRLVQNAKNGLWEVPAGTLELRLPGSIAVKVKDMVGARIILRDKKGNVVSYEWLGGNMDRERGIMYFPTYLLGTGDIIIDYHGNDGTVYSRAFDLKNEGKEIKFERIATSVAAVVSGVEKYVDPVSVVSMVESQNGFGKSPLVQIKMSAAGPVKIGAVTSEGELAKGFWVFDPAFGSDPTYYSLEYERVKAIDFPCGLSNLVYEWETLKDPEQWRALEY